MSTVDVMQKLLVPWVSTAIVEQGHSVVEGPVVRAGDAAGLDTPEKLLAAYGFEGPASPWGAEPQPYVDVLRFPVEPLMRLETPPADEVERPWPTYPRGFLRGDSLVPVWMLERTRVPVGTEFWRIAHTGEQKALSVYDGPALGWRGAPGYFPPLHVVGPRAEWHGLDLPAAFLPEGRIELVHVGDQAPAPEFEQVRPQVWRAEVPLAACDRVFEVVLTATVDGVPVRVLQQAGDQALVLLLTDDPAAAELLGAGEAEPGIFEGVVPAGKLEGVEGAMRQLERDPGQA